MASSLKHETTAEQVGANSELLRDGTILKVVQLGIERIEEAFQIESQAYSAPWSRELLLGEFAKSISFRPAVIKNDMLLAQSFNYIVADELHILNIAVDPRYQGQGYGKFLLREILRLAVERGVTIAILEVRRTNRRAQNLYTRHGFKLTAIRPKYYRNNSEDALVFERRL